MVISPLELLIEKKTVFIEARVGLFELKQRHEVNSKANDW